MTRTHFVEALIRQYRLHLTVEEYRAIMVWETQRLDYDKDYDDYDLCTQLDNILGVFDSDHNGHFGSYVFVNVCTENDDVYTWDKIHSIINKAISEGLELIGDTS